MATKIIPDKAYTISDDIQVTPGIVEQGEDFSLQVYITSESAKETGIPGAIMLTIPEVSKLIAVLIAIVREEGIPALAIRVGKDLRRIVLPDVNLQEFIDD